MATNNATNTSKPVSATQGGTGLSAYTTGDLLYASASNTLSALAVGSFGSHLGVNATNVAWISPTSYMYYYDDFMHFEFGNWSNNTLNSGSLDRNVSGVAGHPGIWRINTATNTAGASNVHLMETSVLLDAGTIMAEWCIKIPTLSDGTDTFTVRIGLLDNFNPAEANNAVEFRYTDGTNSGKWVLVARNGGSETTTNSSSTVGTGFTRLTIVIVPGTPVATFYVDGSSVGTVTSNIPTTNAVGMHAQIVKSAGTNSRSVQIDYAYIFQQLASAR